MFRIVLLSGVIGLLSLTANCQTLFKTWYPGSAQKKGPINEEIVGIKKNGVLIKNGPYKKYFEASGKLALKGTYKNDVKTGQFVEYYEFGIEKWICSFSNGYKQGDEIYFSPDGTVKSKATYETTFEEVDKDSVANSRYTEFLPNKTKIAEGTLLNGKFHGNFISYYPSGKLKSQIHYENGARNGPFKIYNNEGIAIQEGFFVNGEVQKELSMKYNDGTLKSVAVFNNGKPNGLMTNYWPNGNKKDEGTYINDSLNGSFQAWFEDGIVKTKSSYQSGLLHGKFERYYPNGRLRIEGNYVNGLKEGEYKEFFESSQVRTIGHYLNDKQHGNSKAYYESGQLHNNFHFESGEKVGENFEYYENGQLKSKLIFTDSKHVKTSVTYYEKGKLKSKSKFKYKPDQQKPGKEIEAEKRITYHPTGSKKEKQFYLNQEKSGIWISWHENGKKHIVQHYSQDKLHGNQKIYTAKGELLEENNYYHSFKDGVCKIFYPEKGQMKELTTYKRGKESGVYYAYFTDGTIQIEGIYTSGRKNKDWHYYDENHKLLKTEKYKRGTLIKTIEN